MLFGIAACILVLPTISSIFLTRHDIAMMHFGVQCRTSAGVAIFRHSLKLNSASRQGLSTGEVITLFSNDANKTEIFLKMMATLIVAPFQVALCLFLIYGQVLRR
jgi:ABC-type bacteriocin/lantibiotic exporter with double-glycine peptidase domain